MDNNLKIINYLGKHSEEAYTMHQLSILLKIPYATFYRNINQMRDLLLVKNIGKAKALSLNLNNPVIKPYLIISSYEEAKDYLKNNKLIKLLHSEIRTNDIVLLFGSYAENKQNDKSDIDLLVINKKGKKSFSLSSFELLHKKQVNPLFISEEEFKAMLRKPDENVGKQAKIKHIILNNPEAFWNLVWKSTRTSLTTA
jgi:predicted nucleotidyltransferase